MGKKAKERQANFHAASELMEALQHRANAMEDERIKPARTRLKSAQESLKRAIMAWNGGRWMAARRYADLALTSLRKAEVEDFFPMCLIVEYKGILTMVRFYIINAICI